MQSLALGYMAAGSGPRLADAGANVRRDLRYKQALAEADANYAALVDEYNQLVDAFNEIHDIGSRLETDLANQQAQITQLEQALALANERAAAAEQSAAALATREAEARRDVEWYKMRHHNVSSLLTQEARDLNRARSEIDRLKAIIAGSTEASDQDLPSAATPAS